MFLSISLLYCRIIILNRGFSFNVGTSGIHYVSWKIKEIIHSLCFPIKYCKNIKQVIVAAAAAAANKKQSKHTDTLFK